MKPKSKKKDIEVIEPEVLNQQEVALDPLENAEQQSSQYLIQRYVDLHHFQLPEGWPKPKRNGKRHTGRDYAITDKQVRLLEMAFAHDYTVVQACLAAGVKEATYYNFVKQFPAFLEIVEALRTVPQMVAKGTLIRELGKSPQAASWYLERRAKDEFSSKQEVHHSGDYAKEPDEERKKQLDKVKKLNSGKK